MGEASFAQLQFRRERERLSVVLRCLSVKYGISMREFKDKYHYAVNMRYGLSLLDLRQLCRDLGITVDSFLDFMENPQVLFDFAPRWKMKSAPANNEPLFYIGTRNAQKLKYYLYLDSADNYKLTKNKELAQMFTRNQYKNYVQSPDIPFLLFKEPVT